MTNAHYAHFKGLASKLNQDSSVVIENNQYEGMTLRDYFAVKVLQGLIISDNYSTVAVTANEAYSFADAMLEARKQTKEQTKDQPKE